MAKTPQFVSQQLLKQLQLSNLNYMVHETPYSVQVTFRKRFIKECSGPNKDFLSSWDEPKKDINIDKINDVNLNLQKKVEYLELANKADKEKKEILEKKIAKIEAEAVKAFENSVVEISTLKNASY